MIKYKTKIKNGQLFVKAKISGFSPVEEVNDRELDVLTRKGIRGILKANHSKKNIIEYTGPAGVCLLDKLKKPVSKYEFFFIMEQIVDIVCKIKNNDLFLHNLILDLRYVFINETTKEMQFIYLPLISNHICVDVLGFMESIIYICIPDENQTADAISRYTRFLKQLGIFREDDIEKYIAKEEKMVLNSIKKYSAGQSGFMTDKPKDYYAHYEQQEDEATGLLGEDEATGLLWDEEEATGLLTEEEEEGTAMLRENQVRYPFIVRAQSDEKILIEKSIFRIGKEFNYVDYCVADNNAVSRSHVDIIIRGDRYFVMDLNSKNHTYINDEMIPAQDEVEIFDGDRLRLANEEFIFRT